ncbi:tetratricopeptide repeat protein [Labedaea rhizosphaerae]|uniref:tetratricopeptide repeat protein n=1 Tax=Labedaea rhizosphaerae TaxID=598644 RepID=UPI00105D72E6|nr:hypothetical protein [Labedaea rhizosphaerae]
MLAADNDGRMCARCLRDQRDQFRTPPMELRNEFWATDDFRAAFESRHIGRVFKVYRNHPRHLQLFGKALNQELLGRWLGLTQTQVSRLENSRAPEQNLKTLQNYARILHIPQSLLWFDLPGQSRVAARARIPSKTSGNETLSQDSILIANTGMDTVELLKRVRTSDVDAATIDALSITVEQLCCDYASVDARHLVIAGRDWLGKVTELLNGKLSLTQHRDILSNAGMLALLVGCLEYDLGDARAAEATRRMALELGRESGETGVVGWAHEMLAWFHLTSGNYRAALAAAESGIQAAGSHSVAVQLHAQQAKAYARMGEAEQVHAALEHGRELLDRLPFPDRPDNHFVVDPDKFDFYAMDTYRVSGQDDLATRNAEEVIRRGTNPWGEPITPMRNAEAQLTLAVVAARKGAPEDATALGLEALRGDRQSRPSLLHAARELLNELKAYGPKPGTEFAEYLDDFKHTK